MENGETTGRNRLYFKLKSLMGLSVLYAVLITSKHNRDNTYIAVDALLQQFTDQAGARFRTTKVTSAFLVRTGFFGGSQFKRGYRQSSLYPIEYDYNRLWDTIQESWRRCAGDREAFQDYFRHLGMEKPKKLALDNIVAEIQTFLTT
jgi:hypothetical protein